MNQKENQTIIDNFTQLLLDLGTQESNFLLEKLIEKEMINPSIVKNKKTLYFIHYKTQNEIESSNFNFYQFNDEIKCNIKKLSMNDWELHKKLIKEGVNPNEIAKIIRNDEIEKLQEIASQENFNFSQLIKPSLYERFSYINQNAVTLIDYAAFFGSIKCFKYLLLNNSRLMNTGKYAVAGGNLEVIHLCEQNHSSFSDSLENVIEFHRNDIFDYIYENKIFGTLNINQLVKKCISSYNYELFLFFKENENIKLVEISSDIIKNCDVLSLKCFLENIDLGKAFVASSEIGNIEIVKLLLEQEGIDINAKDIHLFYSKFI